MIPYPSHQKELKKCHNSFQVWNQIAAKLLSCSSYPIHGGNGTLNWDSDITMEMRLNVCEYKRLKLVINAILTVIWLFWSTRLQQIQQCNFYMEIFWRNSIFLKCKFYIITICLKIVFPHSEQSLGVHPLPCVQDIRFTLDMCSREKIQATG